MLVHHKLLIVKHSVQEHRLKVNSFVNLVDVDNMVTFGLSLNRTKLEQVLNLKTKLLVGLSLVNTSLLYNTELKNPWKMVYWQDIRYSISKLHYMMEVAMTLTQTRWHLILRDQWHGKKLKTNVNMDCLTR